jgi:hypothetical protein
MIAKVPKSPVMIPDTVTLVVSATTVMLILDALGEKPYKVAGPAIAEIEPQILQQQVRGNDDNGNRDRTHNRGNRRGSVVPGNQKGQGEPQGDAGQRDLKPLRAGPLVLEPDAKPN